MPTDDSNLVRRALHAVGRRAAVHVDKQIPAGGGLGGGSADAAAVLRWAESSMWRWLRPSAPTCLLRGRRSGHGVGRRRERGAARVRRRPSRSSRRRSPYRPPRSTGPGTSSADRADGPNDLEPAALAVAPELGAWRDRVGAHRSDAVSPGAVRPGSSRAPTPTSPPRCRGVRGGDAHRPPVDAPGGRRRRGLEPATCFGAGGAYGEASSCASSSACACGAS